MLWKTTTRLLYIHLPARAFLTNVPPGKCSLDVTNFSTDTIEVAVDLAKYVIMKPSLAATH
jgi:hypothetical protein